MPLNKETKPESSAHAPLCLEVIWTVSGDRNQVMEFGVDLVSSLVAITPNSSRSRSRNICLVPERVRFFKNY